MYFKEIVLDIDDDKESDDKESNKSKGNSHVTEEITNVSVS